MVVMTGLFLTAVVGCKKDDNKDDDPPVTVKKYRITNVVQTQGSDATETKLEYNSDNKLVSFTDYEDGVAVYRSTWTYTGNEAKLSESYFEGGQWVVGPYYETYTYSGNHLTEGRVYESEDELMYLVTYIWDGDRVTEENREYYYQDSIMGNYSMKYTYSGAQLTMVEYTMFDQLVQKKIIEYADGKPVSIKSYSGENMLEESIEMLYAGNLLTKINNFNVSEGVVGTIACTEDRTYDDNNNAYVINMQCTDETPFNSALTWEEGAGNLNDVILANIGWLTAYLFPDTFPSELLFTTKSPVSPGKHVGTGRDLSIVH